MKKLVITEKPSVAMEFAKVLEPGCTRGKGFYEGQNYIFTWCVGHLLTLSMPEKYGEEFTKWSFDTLPFIPGQYRYEVISNVADQFSTVKKCLNRDDIDTIYYAGDAAREGEYIARLVRQAAGRNKNAVEKRVWIDSQTEDEIRRGINEAKPLADYDNMSDAGYARAIEDYLVGINFSRALSVKYGRAFNNLAKTSKYTPISAGRVMTCVLGMITERERNIRNAVEIPFFGVQADIGKGVNAKWKATKSSRLFESPALFKDDSFSNQNDAQALLDSLVGQKLVVSEFKNDKEKKNAPMLFNLAELQNECSRKFKISPDETLQIVQTLYDKKLTTYPRTDARVLSSAIGSEIYKNLNGLRKFTEMSTEVEDTINFHLYENINQTKYVNDAMVSDHYAIIPTGASINEYNSLGNLEQSVFKLIVKRFLSIFRPAAVYNKFSATFNAGNEQFFLSAKKLEETGYLALYGLGDEEEEDKDAYVVLSGLSKGMELNPDYSMTKGTTSAPKRYNSGSIILAMENAGNLIEDPDLRETIKNSGIGTSATRAETIKKLVKNGYILLDKKTQILKPSMSGEIIYEITKATVPSLLNPAMTASWEKGLSAIENGAVTKAEYLDKMDSYIKSEIAKMKEKNVMEDLAANMAELKQVYKEMGDMNSSQVSGDANLIKCPHCGNPIRKYDWGYGCTGYKEGCKVSISKTIFGSKLTDTQMKNLLEKGKIKNIKFHSEKKNTDYTAGLTINYEDGKVSLVFDNDKE